MNNNQRLPKRFWKICERYSIGEEDAQWMLDNFVPKGELLLSVDYGVPGRDKTANSYGKIHEDGTVEITRIEYEN